MRPWSHDCRLYELLSRHRRADSYTQNPALPMWQGDAHDISNPAEEQGFAYRNTERRRFMTAVETETEAGRRAPALAGERAHALRRAGKSSVGTIIAASMGKVPLPQNGSTRIRSLFHGVSMMRAAASVSVIGALLVSVR